MKKVLLVLGCILFFFTSSVDAQILSPVAHLEGTISHDTRAVFIGATRLFGNFEGFPVESLIDISAFEDINTFPMFGSNVLEDIDTVKIIDVEQMTDIDSWEDIINIDVDNFSSFSDVDIVGESGSFLLMTDQGEMVIDSDLNYAISSIISLNIGGDALTFFMLLSSSHIDIQYNGESTVFVQYSENSTVVIKDPDGVIVWSGSLKDRYLLIEDDGFILSQGSPLYLFPLVGTHNPLVELSISPADPQFIDISSLLDEHTTVTEGFIDIPDFTNMIQGFDSLIEAASSMVNGGMALVETDDTLIIDDTPQTFSNVGFARANQFDVTIPSGNNGSIVEGEYKLIFLGDHLYTAQAKDSRSGVTFPFILVFVWLIAIALFLLFRFYIKKDINRVFDEKIKRYTLIFHIAALILAFILMDREISYQFGTSVLDIILGSGVSIILLAFIVVELIMWILGYVALALPVRIITNSGLKWFGIGEDGKDIGKGVGALFIWVFCAFYIKLIVNLILLFINPSGLFPMG